MEGNNLFAYKEVEEKAKEESMKTFIPWAVPNVTEAAEEQKVRKCWCKRFESGCTNTGAYYCHQGT